MLVSVGLLVLFWILWPRTRTAEQKPESLASNERTNATATAPTVPPHPGVRQIPAKAYDTNPSNRFEMMRKAIDDKNVPIDFYGQTVDQDGNPLSGVHVAVRVRHWNIAALANSIPVHRDTDISGMFDIHNVTGDAFDLEGMSKEGYQLELTHRGFGPTGGAPGNPIVFKLWRKDIKEPLVKGKKTFNIIPDGRTYTIDITNGVIKESDQGTGDIKVWVTRPQSVELGQHFDWSCGIQVINGGLSQEPDLSSPMYVAPTDGYFNSFQFEESATRNGWGDGTGPRRFYISLNGGHQLGRMVVDIYAYYKPQVPGLIRIDYAINPTGSHILR